MNQQPSIAEIKAALQARIRDLVRELAPDQGREQGGIYTPLNPTRADRHPGSFVIWTTRGVAGAWKDYATSEGGDVLDLIGYCKGLDRTGAIRWAKVWTGLDRGPLPAGNLKPRLAAMTPGEEIERKRKLAASAKQLWLACQPSLLGTVAEQYLRGRGIELAALPRQPGSLRFHPALEWHGEHETRKYPAIVAAMQRDHRIVAAHRTYLAPDGSGKADVSPARKVLGDPQGAVIPIARGQSDLPLRQANEAGIADTLVLTEGIEDGLTIALADPEPRVWAAYSLGNLAAIELPPCAHEWIMFAHNDWGAQAEAALKRGTAALYAQNARGRIARAEGAKDANELLQTG